MNHFPYVKLPEGRVGAFGIFGLEQLPLTEPELQPNNRFDRQIRMTCDRSFFVDCDSYRGQLSDAVS